MNKKPQTNPKARKRVRKQTPRRVAARLKGAVKNRGIKSKKK